LRDIAKQLGAVVKEESVRFDHDEEDDQLIQYVNALSVYVVEKKCTKCERYCEREQKVRAVLSTVIVPEDEEDLLVFCERVKPAFDELKKQSGDRLLEINRLKGYIRHLEDVDHEILNAFGADHDFDDIGDHLRNTWHHHAKKIEQQMADLKQAKTAALDEFSQSLLTKIVPLLKDSDFSTTDRADCTIEAANRLLAQYSEAVDELSTAKNACMQTVERIPRFLELASPQTSNLYSAVLSLLDTLENIQNPLAPVLGEIEGKYRLTINSIHILGNRLRGVVSCDIEGTTAMLSAQELTSHTLQVLDAIHDKFKDTEKHTVAMQNQIDQMRKEIESLDLKMHKFLNQEDINLREIPLKDLLQRTKRFCDQITHLSASREFMPVHDVNSMFSAVFPIVPISSTSDPRRYIPEICAGMLSLHNSVMALKPFSVNLGEMWTIVDTKSDASNPNSASYNSIRQKTYDLHQCLKRISPTKVNSLVFGVMQKFTTLLSTFFAAIADTHTEAFVTRET
jgi:hypothetical protein